MPNGAATIETAESVGEATPAGESSAMLERANDRIGRRRHARSRHRFDHRRSRFARFSDSPLGLKTGSQQRLRLGSNSV